MLHQLHWLLIKYWIRFKILTLMFKGLKHPRMIISVGLPPLIYPLESVAFIEPALTGDPWAKKCPVSFDQVQGFFGPGRTTNVTPLHSLRCYNQFFHIVLYHLRIKQNLMASPSFPNGHMRNGY